MKKALAYFTMTAIATRKFFSEPHPENLTGFLDEKPVKVWGASKTDEPSSFLLSPIHTPYLENWLNLSFKCSFHFIAPVASF